MAVIVSESISGSDWSDNVLTESENCIGIEQTNGADCHTIQNKKQKLSLIAKAQWLASNPTLKITTRRKYKYVQNVKQLEIVKFQSKKK